MIFIFEVYFGPICLCLHFQIKIEREGRFWKRKSIVDRQLRVFPLLKERRNMIKIQNNFAN